MSPPRVSAAQHLVVLAPHLTERDRRLCRLLADHRVLTTRQVTALLGYPSQALAEQRLRILHRLQVLDRFRLRPRRPYHGGVDDHHVLGAGGAAVVAAERGQDLTRFRYRRDRAMGLAHSSHLKHLLATNDFFAQLAATANRTPGAELVDWWPARRCAARWKVIRPDGYCRWREDGREVDFFLELDRGTESTAQLLAKLTGYTALAQASGIATPVLFWFVDVGNKREANLHASLGVPPVLVATAVAHPETSPAASVWRKAGRNTPRQRLITLAAPW